MQSASLSQLRARHLELLGQWAPDLEPEALSGLVPRIETLRGDAQAIGVWLDDGDDRDRAQGIIDYWTAALMGLPGHALPEMMRLAPFDASAAEAAVERAEQIVSPHDGTAIEDEAEAMLTALVRTGPDDRIHRRAPVERSALVEAGEEVQGDMLDRLCEAGVIHRIARPGEEDCYELAQGSIARAWPRLGRWLEKRRTRHDTRERLRATAQLWKQSGDRGYLLAGEALSEAGRYIGQDPLLNEFIRVSRNAADRRRKQWLAASIFLVIGVIGATFIAFNLGAYLGFDEGRVAGYDKAVLKQEEIVQPEPAKPQAAPSPDEQGRGLAGWIWAGSPDQPQLFDAESGRPVDPGSLVVNRRYRIGNDLWLRTGLPNADGEAAERVSVAPRGGLVIVREAPAPVERPAGTQYWVRVGVVPRVYIQFANASREQIERLRGALIVAGFEVPRAEPHRQARNLRDVRYFRPENAAMATWLASSLAGNFTLADGSPIEIRCLRSKSGLSSANLEIWLDFEGLRIARPERPIEARCL